MAVIGVAWAVSVADTATPVTVIGSVAAVVLVAGAVVAILSMSGLLDTWLPGVRHTVDDVHGGGVELRASRITLPLLFILGGGAGYGIAAWLDWKTGSGSDLLPLSKNNSAGATFALVIGVLLAVFFLIFLIAYFTVTVELYPDGVRRIMRFPLLGRSKQQFVAWDEMAAIAPDKVQGAAQTGGYAVIGMQLKDTREPVQHKLWDTTERVSVPVYLMRCESNTLLALLRYLLSHPQQRVLLAQPDAPSWFAPPPRSTQIQLSHQATATGAT
ncbi:hypothetical protein AWN90_09455 [Nocardia terpenica]|uniref:Uncharacterized protein n=1 Tax=Nocardia terpenica TaxID=455432 RepID=A0A164H2Z9_9NOCA|nr:hypothetical protein AWN90_09455 [Nocardia terpenica]